MNKYKCSKRSKLISKIVYYKSLITGNKVYGKVQYVTPDNRVWCARWSDYLPSVEFDEILSYTMHTFTQGNGGWITKSMSTQLTYMPRNAITLLD